MFELSLKKNVRTHTCRTCGTQWESTAYHAFLCASCRPTVERARRSQLHAESRARVKAANAKLELAKTEQPRDWPRDSESTEPSVPMIRFCDAYHNGRAMRSRSVVL